MKIVAVHGQEILDSRGNPTVAATVTLVDGTAGWAAVPSGASTGTHEAVELRDGDPKYYNGLGVLHAVENVNEKISKAVIGVDAQNQKTLDQTMVTLDGTENKSNLGANAILAVSLAAARAEAASEKKPLYQYLSELNPDFSGNYNMPIPQMNVLNGGKHGNWSTDIQEYMILPIGAKSMQEGIRMCAETYFHLKKTLKEHNYSLGLGDEGGFAPQFSSNEEPFLMLNEAVQKAGYTPGKDISFGIDAAASEFYKDGSYHLSKENKQLTAGQLAEFYGNLLGKFPIISVEDVFAEDDWEGFTNFMTSFGQKVQIVGDDLYVTNVKRIQQGIDTHASNAVLIKLNQIGTLTETIDAILLARKNGMHAIISHRSGETEDAFIADLAVGMGTGQIKTGAPARGERTAKYNRLLTIAQELEKNAAFSTFPQ